MIEKLGQNYLALHNEILAIGNEMYKRIFELITDQHGNHVIQSILNTFKATEHPHEEDYPGAEAIAVYSQFIYNACIVNCEAIGSSRFGCCVIQRCLEKGLKSQKYSLANVIIQRVSFLIEDPYGNYLIQNVLKLRNPYLTDQILNHIASDFVRLSQLKFSSNVIEKCLESGQATQ